MTPIVCPWCGARSDGDLCATLAAVLRCNNCLLDLDAKGQWNGIGYAILRALGLTHGRVAFEAALAEAEAAMPSKINAAPKGRF